MKRIKIPLKTSSRPLYASFYNHLRFLKAFASTEYWRLPVKWRFINSIYYRILWRIWIRKNSICSSISYNRYRVPVQSTGKSRSGAKKKGKGQYSVLAFFFFPPAKVSQKAPEPVLKKTLPVRSNRMLRSGKSRVV